MTTFDQLQLEIRHIFESGANKERILAMCLQQFKTGAVDVTGREIVLGDIVTWDNCDSSSFEIVFEHGAYRKKYKTWDETLQKPLLEINEKAFFKVIGSMFYT